MKSLRRPLVVLSLVLPLSPSALFAQTPQSALLKKVDWAQPPVACVEDIVPAMPNRPCLDLTRVEDPRKDWPEHLSESELAYWRSQKRVMPYCRGSEVLRREAEKAGSFSPVAVQVSWMQVSGATNRDQKVKAIYAASRAHQMPPQVLTGALYQESLFAELGIASDGGNYSCGVGQINIQEWCRWANAQSAEKKAKLNWPGSISCSVVPSKLVEPFYEIAKTRLKGLPEYRLQKEHFTDIKEEQVVKSFPEASTAVQKLRYRAVRSFLDNCSDPMNGISAKANELAALYRNFVPQGMKEREMYRTGDTFRKTCRETYPTNAYPLHSGWLLAVGAYNAGPRVVDALAHYNRWTRADLAQSWKFRNFTPANLVEAFYGAGKYNSRTDKIHFKTLNGEDGSWIWFKSCVLQRHIARVIQHVTAGAPIVQSVEGDAKCVKSTVDPRTRKTLTSVPMSRQLAPGQRAAN